MQETLLRHNSIMVVCMDPLSKDSRRVYKGFYIRVLPRPCNVVPVVVTLFASYCGILMSYVLGLGTRRP